MYKPGGTCRTSDWPCGEYCRLHGVTLRPCRTCPFSPVEWSCDIHSWWARVASQSHPGRAQRDTLPYTQGSSCFSHLWQGRGRLLSSMGRSRLLRLSLLSLPSLSSCLRASAQVFRLSVVRMPTGGAFSLAPLAAVQIECRQMAKSSTVGRFFSDASRCTA